MWNWEALKDFYKWGEFKSQICTLTIYVNDKYRGHNVAQTVLPNQVSLHENQFGWSDTIASYANYWVSFPLLRRGKVLLAIQWVQTQNKIH